ncbi:SDR family oxidoreductase [Shewanella surugensis]|nr:SDR family oxidoreductase [Shewanella surugensis]
MATPAYEEWFIHAKQGQEMGFHIEDHIPLERRMTRPEEIAAMVLMLASSQSSHTTGQIMYIDGGYVHLDRVLGR